MEELVYLHQTRHLHTPQSPIDLSSDHTPELFTNIQKFEQNVAELSQHLGSSINPPTHSNIQSLDIASFNCISQTNKLIIQDQDNISTKNLLEWDNKQQCIESQQFLVNWSFRNNITRTALSELLKWLN